MRSRFFVILRVVTSVACIAFFLGCGSGKGRGSGNAADLKPIDSDLLALVPEGIQVALWVDLEAFRSSQFYFVLKELLGDDFAAVPNMGAFDPVGRGKELVVALRGDSESQGAGQFLALLRSDMTKEEVTTWFADVEGAVSEQQGSFPSVRTPDMVVMFLTDKTIAIGSQYIISQVVDLAENRGTSLRQREGFHDFRLEKGEVAKLLYKRGSVVPNLEQYGAARPPVDFDAIAEGGGVLKLDTGLFLELQLSTNTQMDAAGMSGELRRLKEQLKGNMLVLFLGIDWMLDRISIQEAKTALTVTLNLDLGDLQNLMQLASRLRKIRELADSGDGGGEVPFDLPDPEQLQSPGAGGNQ